MQIVEFSFRFSYRASDCWQWIPERTQSKPYSPRTRLIFSSPKITEPSSYKSWTHSGALSSHNDACLAHTNSLCNTRVSRVWNTRGVGAGERGTAAEGSSEHWEGGWTQGKLGAPRGGRPVGWARREAVGGGSYSKIPVLRLFLSQQEAGGASLS